MAESPRPASIMLGQREVRFQVKVGHGGENGIVFLSLHSNEMTSREVVVELLDTFGGLYVGIEAGGQRRLHLRPREDEVTIDPNRMFSRPGIERDLRRGAIARLGDVELIEDFAASYLRSFLEGARVVVAVHNNTRGGYSIRSYLEGGSEERAASQVHLSSVHGIDDFFLVTEPEHFEALAALDYNVVLQAENPPDDGSLSVYAAKQGIRYVNVEAEHGAAAVQRGMMEDLLRILESDPRQCGSETAERRSIPGGGAKENQDTSKQ